LEDFIKKFGDKKLADANMNTLVSKLLLLTLHMQYRPINDTLDSLLKLKDNVKKVFTAALDDYENLTDVDEIELTDYLQGINFLVPQDSSDTSVVEYLDLESRISLVDTGFFTNDKFKNNNFDALKYIQLVSQQIKD
jgi:uncharacterized protein YfkK (UPF0435 family)